MFLLRLFGSKKLIAAITGVIAVVLVPVLNAKLHLSLNPAVFGGAFASIAGVVLAYIAAQWHIDISTNGDTTTSALLKSVAEGSSGPVPASVVSALQVAAVLLPAGAGKDAVEAALADIGHA